MRLVESREEEEEEKEEEMEEACNPFAFCFNVRYDGAVSYLPEDGNN